MFISQALRFSATASAKRATVSGKRFGEPWALAEVKRVVPGFVAWATFLTVTLGWPFGIKKYALTGRD